MSQPPTPQPGWSIQGSPPPGEGSPPAGMARLALPPQPPRRRRGPIVVVGAVALVFGLLIGILVGKSTASGPANDASGQAQVPGTGGTATASTSVLAHAKPAAATSPIPAPRGSGTSSRAVKPAPTQRTRTNSGAKLTVLGSGTFTVGQDLPPGRYVITPKTGESGNLSATTTDDPVAINAILGDADGLGVPTYTATMTKGEVVKISGMSRVRFTPAVTKLHTSLSAGDWEVDLDVAAGRYVVTPAHGESGNFTVYDADGLPVTNEILGQASGLGVPDVTVSLSSGNRIEISGLTDVVFTKK